MYGLWPPPPNTVHFNVGRGEGEAGSSASAQTTAVGWWPRSPTGSKNNKCDQPFLVFLLLAYEEYKCPIFSELCPLSTLQSPCYQSFVADRRIGPSPSRKLFELDLWMKTNIFIPNSAGSNILYIGPCLQSKTGMSVWNSHVSLDWEQRALIASVADNL